IGLREGRCMANGYHEVAPIRLRCGLPRRFPTGFRVLTWLAAVLGCSAASAAQPQGTTQFRQGIEPILVQYCAGCHNSELKKGDVAFDRLDSDAALLENQTLWLKALKMLRAGLMPPRDKPRPSAEEMERLEHWIKRWAFQIDPQNPDPGRVT